MAIQSIICPFGPQLWIVDKFEFVHLIQHCYIVNINLNVIYAGARLLWDGVSFLELTVPPKMRGLMCGLCGNFNGAAADDFRGRGGQLLSSGQQFGNSWRVGGRKACSVLPRDVPARPPTCRGDWEVRPRRSLRMRSCVHMVCA